MVTDFRRPTVMQPGETKMLVILKLLVWFIRAILLLLGCVGLLWVAQVVHQFLRGGVPAVEGWFYWHILMMGAPLEQHSVEHVLHLAHRFYLRLFLLVSLAEILLLLQWKLANIAKKTRTQVGG